MVDHEYIVLGVIWLHPVSDQRFCGKQSEIVELEGHRPKKPGKNNFILEFQAMRNLVTGISEVIWYPEYLNHPSVYLHRNIHTAHNCKLSWVQNCVAKYTRLKMRDAEGKEALRFRICRLNEAETMTFKIRLEVKIGRLQVKIVLSGEGKIFNCTIWRVFQNILPNICCSIHIAKKQINLTAILGPCSVA